MHQFCIQFDLKVDSMENANQIETAINQLAFVIEPELLAKYGLAVVEEDNKALKKKIKKQQIQAEDNNQKAVEKTTKLLDDLCKSYEAAGKQFAKMKAVRISTDSSQAEREKMNKQKVMIENLFNSFKKRYDEEIEKATQIEKEEEAKRKAIIEELQERIKSIQSKYQETGKAKIEKYKQNQTLKHELSKYEPHLVASESLADAQLKKKSIEIEIQMTTLKQKIEMMDNFKNMRVETEEKLKNSKQVEDKLAHRLGKIQVKEEEHKLNLAKAHLIFQDYKKAFNVLKDLLPKKERDALLSKQKVKKSTLSLQQQRKKLTDLDKDYDTHAKQLQVLVNLEKQLQNQLKE